MKDLTGQRFGRLVARQPTEKRLGTSVVWECICDCGNTVYVGSQNLGSFHTQSCGCLQKDIAAELAKSKNNKCANLTGQRFGRLIAVRATDQRSNKKVIWECKCDCGNTAYVKSTLLKNGTTSSCGCLQKETMTDNAKKLASNLSGQRFGRLIAVRATEERNNNKVIWECKCDCGNTVYVKSTLLKNGHTASCGCLRIETLARNRQQKGEQDPQKSCSNECHKNE